MNTKKRKISISLACILTAAILFSLILGIFNSENPIIAANELEVTDMSYPFTNPIAPRADDPWVVYHEPADKYYYIWSDGPVRVAEIADFYEIDRTKIPESSKWTWNPPASGPYSKEVWAPELHYLNGEWYIYVACSDGNNATHRMYVLKGRTQNPLDGFDFIGKITDPSDKWAIDGTVMQYDGKMYYIWSGWEGSVDGKQNTYIAEMSDPLTISSERVMISSPDLYWEQRGWPLIQEGAVAVEHNGLMHIMYSASFSGTDDYCVGLLTLTGEDPLDPNAWTKKDTPILSKLDGMYGPGHPSVVKSRDGRDWIIYHANQNSGTGWGGRNGWAQLITWDENNYPIININNPEPAFNQAESIKVTSNGVEQTLYLIPNAFTEGYGGEMGATDEQKNAPITVTDKNGDKFTAWNFTFGCLIVKGENATAGGGGEWGTYSGSWRAIGGVNISADGIMSGIPGAANRNVFNGDARTDVVNAANTWLTANGAGQVTGEQIKIEFESAYDKLTESGFGPGSNNGWEWALSGTMRGLGDTGGMDYTKSVLVIKNRFGQGTDFSEVHHRPFQTWLVLGKDGKSYAVKDEFLREYRKDVSVIGAPKTNEGIYVVNGKTVTAQIFELGYIVNNDAEVTVNIFNGDNYTGAQFKADGAVFIQKPLIHISGNEWKTSDWTGELPESSTPESSVPASSTPASSTPASSTPASSTPASSTPASSAPASSTPASSIPASSTPASSTPASSIPAESGTSSGPYNEDDEIEQIKISLKKHIDMAKEILENNEFGYDIGKYSLYSKNELERLIEKGEEVYDNPNAKLSDVSSICTYFENYILLFDDNIITNITENAEIGLVINNLPADADRIEVTEVTDESEIEKIKIFISDSELNDGENILDYIAALDISILDIDGNLLTSVNEAGGTYTVSVSLDKIKDVFGIALDENKQYFVFDYNNSPIHAYIIDKNLTFTASHFSIYAIAEVTPLSSVEDESSIQEPSSSEIPVASNPDTGDYGNIIIMMFVIISAGAILIVIKKVRFTA